MNTGSDSNRRPWLVTLTMTAIACWLVVTCWDLWRWALAAQQLPRWDMAKYGAAASRLHEALQSFDGFALLSEIHQLSSWPFVMPLLEALAFAVFGNEFSTARCLMVGIFALTCWLAVHLAWRLGGSHPESGLLALWTATLIISSPMLHLYGVLNMLEMPGTLLTLMALAAYFHLLTDPTKRSSWWVLGGVSTLLFFCKYNYGLIWCLALGLAEVRRRAGSWRRGLCQAWKGLMHRPFGVWEGFVLVVVSLLACLRLSGGEEWGIGSMTLRATSIGNPMYGLLLLTVARHLFWTRHRRLLVHRWRGLASSTRILFYSLGLPVLLWMLVPPHCKDFFGFVENRSSGLDRWSLDSWWFYGRSLGEDFLAWPWLAVPLVCLALWSCMRFPRWGAGPRVLALLVIVNSAALLAHPYKLPRFAVTLFVPLVLLALRGLIDIVVVLCRLWARRERRGLGTPSRGTLSPSQGSGLLAASLGLAFILVSTEHLARPFDDASLSNRLVEQTISAAHLPMLDRILDLAESNGDTALVGTWNLFSPALVEWRQAQRRQGQHLQGRHLQGQHLQGQRGASDRIWVGRSLVRHLRHHPWPKQVIVLELMEEHWRSDLQDAYRAETVGLESQMALFSAGADFEAERTESWEVAGYRLHLFRCKQGTNVCGSFISD